MERQLQYYSIRRSLVGLVSAGQSSEQSMSYRLDTHTIVPGNQATTVRFMKPSSIVYTRTVTRLVQVLVLLLWVLMPGYCSLANDAHDRPEKPAVAAKIPTIDRSFVRANFSEREPQKTPETAGRMSSTSSHVAATLAGPDSDGDGVTDDIDLDDDNDGILDTAEMTCQKIVNGTFDTNTSSWSVTGNIAVTAAGLWFNQNDAIPNGVISQTTITTSGSPYELSYVVAGALGNVQKLGNVGVRVDIIDVATNTVIATKSVIKNVAPAASTEYLTFNAIGSVTRIRFTDISTETVAIDVVIDNVSILYCDTDNDGIPNSLDTDSDGDGCPDAIEGGAAFTTANLTPLGTLSGAVWTSSAPLGVPVIASAGQAIGTSQNAAVQDVDCPQLDSDGDGIPDITDLDDDNDGILDTVECAFAFITNPSGTTVTPTIKVCYNTNAYGLNGTYMGFNDDKLLNPVNFGPSGTYKVNFQLIPITPANITESNLNAQGCQIFQVGMDNTDAASGTSFGSLTTAQKNELKAWSSNATDHMVLGFQGLAATWNSYVGSTGVTGQMVSTDLGEPLYNGPFGNANGFNQGGGYQGKYSSLPSGAYCSLITDQAGNVIAFVDKATGDIFFGGMSTYCRPWVV